MSVYIVERPPIGGSTEPILWSNASVARVEENMLLTWIFTWVVFVLVEITCFPPGKLVFLSLKARADIVYNCPDRSLMGSPSFRPVCNLKNTFVNKLYEL